MSIACANLFTRNLYKEFIHPDCTEAQEATMAKIVSLVVKIGAVVFILALPHDYAIQLQLSAASGSSSFCPRSARALYALTQCASSSGGMGGRARRWNLHGGGAGLHIRGLFLVGVWNDVCSTLFGRGEFHARHRADAALQPSSATDCPIGVDGAGDKPLACRRQRLAPFEAPTLDPRGVTR